VHIGVKNMKKIIIIATLLIFTQGAYSCSKSDIFEFGGFSKKKTGNENNRWQEDYGRSVIPTQSGITISFDFLTNLANSPTGEELSKNREEFLYLIATGHEEATYIGLLILDHLIKVPKFSYECGVKFERFGKEELAFNLGRSGKVFGAFCRLKKEALARVLALYDKHPKLWGMVYDHPSAPGSLNCNQLNKSLKSDTKKRAL
jgi:hypothetical protein